MLLLSNFYIFYDILFNIESVIKMLKIENLTKYYDKVLAVDDISFDIKKGEIFGFIGPNGAGKSTTIKCILKLVNINKGNITIDGIDINNNEDYKEKIGYLPSEVSLYKEMLVKDILKYSNSFYKKDYTKNIKRLVKILEIDTNKKIEDLSFGNLKKVGIVLAMMHEPQLLILDEPTSGLDPLKQEAFFELLEEEKEKGTTIFFSSHNLNEVKRICDRVGIIKNGKLVKIESVENLIHNNFIVISIKGEIENLDFDNIIVKDKNDIKFIYKGDVNELISNLSKVKLDSLIIEEPSLEDIFMHYYRGEDNV